MSVNFRYNSAQRGDNKAWFRGFLCHAIDQRFAGFCASPGTSPIWKRFTGSDTMPVTIFLCCICTDYYFIECAIEALPAECPMFPSFTDLFMDFSPWVTTVLILQSWMHCDCSLGQALWVNCSFICKVLCLSTAS